MKKVVGKPFVGKTVPLDGHHYEKCDFRSCTFVYSATDDFTLRNNVVSDDCIFRFTGAAGNTVATLKAIYSIGEWGRQTIISTFQNIAPDLKNLH